MARLDVAIFNAILRESADEMPSDPISDPISDAEVLPIPAGKASFGAGAQLKIAVRVLVELFPVRVVNVYMIVNLLLILMHSIKSITLCHFSWFFTSRNKLNFYELQIGNWSRWITELVGSGGANSVDDETRADNDDDGSEYDFSSESFHLLNALSDLMLLPKDMLLSRTIRKEVHLKTLKLSCLLPIVHISFSLLMMLLEHYPSGLSHIWSDHNKKGS